MRCRQCGYELPAESRFCPECGAPVSERDATVVTAYRTARETQSTAWRDWLILVGVLAAVTAAYFVVKEAAAPPEGEQSRRQAVGESGSSAMDGMPDPLRDLPQDYSSLVELGNRLMDERNYPLAAECYRRVLQMDESALDVRVDYGACLHGMGLPQRALEEFRNVLSRDSLHVIAIFNLGIVYYDLNEVDSARTCWQKYLRLDPNGPAASKARELLAETDG